MSPTTDDAQTASTLSSCIQRLQQKSDSLDQSTSESVATTAVAAARGADGQFMSSGDPRTNASVTSSQSQATSAVGLDQSPTSARRASPGQQIVFNVGSARSPEYSRSSSSRSLQQQQQHTVITAGATTRPRPKALSRHSSEVSTSPQTPLSVSVLQQAVQQGSPPVTTAAAYDDDEEARRRSHDVKFLISPGGSGQVSPRGLAQQHAGSLTLIQWIKGLVRM